MVSNMKGAKLEDEITRVQEMLKAARIDFHLEGSPELTDTPLFVENVLSMCLKEAVTTSLSTAGRLPVQSPLPHQRKKY